VLGQSVGNALLRALQNVANLETVKRAATRAGQQSPFTPQVPAPPIDDPLATPLPPTETAAPPGQATPTPTDADDPFDNAPQINLPDISPPNLPPSGAPNVPTPQPAPADPLAPGPNSP
jgi:hypothetical protein